MFNAVSVSIKGAVQNHIRAAPFLSSNPKTSLPMNLPKRTPRTALIHPLHPQATSRHTMTQQTTNTQSITGPAETPGKTYGGVDPYLHVEMRPLYAADAMRSHGRTVRITDTSDPSGFREVGLVSPDYVLVPNADVRDLALEVAARSGLGFEVEQTFFDGKRYALSLVSRDRGLVETRVGDYVGLGLRFENSYDGSTKLSASLFAYRLACKNGMLVPELFERVAFKHLRSISGWEDEVQRTLRMVGSSAAGLERFAHAARALASMRVGAGRLREIRQEVLPKLPVTLWGKTIDRFLAHEQLDGFGLLNAVTNVTWHDPNPSASTYRHNEYATQQLVRYALASVN